MGLIKKAMYEDFLAGAALSVKEEVFGHRQQFEVPVPMYM